MKKMLVGIVLMVTLGIIALAMFKPKDLNLKTDYENMKLDGNESLMIVAHPDDEILWGGEEVINEDYVVVCITCGESIARAREFEKVMAKTKDKYIMLSYPDKVNGERSNWENCYSDIEDDIKRIFNLQDWKKIVTHNPDGEYGHIHHKMTNKIVTEKLENKDKLYYFGKYYSKKNLENLEEVLPSMDEEILKEKEEILKIYKTQTNTIKNLSHMNPYEDIKPYSEWQEINDDQAQ